MPCKTIQIPAMNRHCATIAKHRFTTVTVRPLSASRALGTLLCQINRRAPRNLGGEGGDTDAPYPPSLPIVLPVNCRLFALRSDPLCAHRPSRGHQLSTSKPTCVVKKPLQLYGLSPRLSDLHAPPALKRRSTSLASTATLKSLLPSLLNLG